MSAPPLRIFRFRVGSGKRVVVVKAASAYAAKQMLTGIKGLADGVSYEFLRPSGRRAKAQESRR